MRVPIQHDLPKDEVRRRLRERSHELADHIPGQVQLDTDWPSEDRMTMSVRAMGQSLDGVIEIEERQVWVDVTLPPLLAFMEPVIANAMRDKGQKLLAKD